MKLVHIIEDERHIREAIVEYINLIGHQAQDFASAEAYIQHMILSDFTPPNLILSDINMPGICGLQLAHQVQKKHPHIIYMLMTGKPEQAIPTRLSGLNIKKVFYKPFPFSHLEDALTAL